MVITIGLARPGRHLRADPRERPAVAGDDDALPFRWRCLDQPDQRLDGFQLAEEEPAEVPLLQVAPVFQQPLGDAARPQVAAFPPRLDPRTDLVHQRQFPEHARVVERLRAGSRRDVTRRSPTFLPGEEPGRPVVGPVARGLLVGRVDDELVDGILRHRGYPRRSDGLGRKGSCPQQKGSSVCSTTMRREGRDRM